MRKKVWNYVFPWIIAIAIMSSNLSFKVLASERETVAEISIITDDEFPVPVEQMLMEAAIIDSSERVSIAEVNSMTNAVNVLAMDDPVEEMYRLTEINPDESGIKALELCDAMYSSPYYLYATKYENGILYQWMYFTDGSVSKNVSCDYDGITYCVSNDNNLSLNKGNSTMYEVKDQLTAEEIAAFYQKLENGEVEEKDAFSIEEVRTALGLEQSQSLYSAVKNAYAGGDYTKNMDTKPLNQYYIGTYYPTISGLSKYYNGSDTANIKEYDTRKSYVESSSVKNFFATGALIMDIVSYTKLALAPTISVLELAGVAISAGSRLSDPVNFYKSQTYSIAAYRESTIYDYTTEKADVELPQLYSSMAIGITYHEYENGVYKSCRWDVTQAPSYNIPSLGIVDANQDQYAAYVADIYYRNCVLHGKWTLGRNAYGGLGG